MPNFTLNNQAITIEENINLLEYLREEANLTSVKNGCAEGACGACMVIVDAKATRACLLNSSKLEGKTVLTLEGFPEKEKEIFALAFAEVGAVQCGFCIPGMVVSGKALLDANNNPNEQEIRKALRFNICRCTGYVKIIKAIKLAAQHWANKDSSLTNNSEKLTGYVGENLHRLDARDKTLGTGLYTDDLKIKDMLFGRALRAPSPRALIKNINIEKAKKHPGIEGILLASDIPGERFIGHLAHISDWPALIAIGEETRYIGDALALVAGNSKKAVNEALALIEVDYEQLPPLTSPKMAMAEGAPKLHPKGNILQTEKLYRGNPSDALKNSKHVLTKHYSLPFTEHAFLEPECAVALPEDDGVLLYTGGQSIYDEQRECALLLGLPNEKVHVISMLVGGGFGGKEDMSVQHHAALLAYKLQKPVKVLLSRDESIKVHPKRHAMEIEMTTACDENGILTAMKCRIISDAGAYASLGGPVLQRACTHAAGPYNYHNIDIIGSAVYTNNPPGGAFRGFGVTQTIFATECNLNVLAEKVGISEWEIRYKNAIRPGQVLPNGQIADATTALVETLESVKDDFNKAKLAGIACGIKNAGVGVGLTDVGRCRLVIKDNTVNAYTSAACIGQGLATVVSQIITQYTHIPHSQIVINRPDTKTSPDSGTTTASRQTVFTGEATKKVALKLSEALKGKNLSDLEGQEFFAEYFGETDPMSSDKENPVSHVAYGYATHLVIMNEETGLLEKVIAVHDVGQAINPKALEGQIEGGVVTSLGYALTEDYPLVDSMPKAKFATLGLFKATNVPEIEVRYLGKPDVNLACGAKGVGEISAIPTAPAVQGAYYKKDGQFRTKLPLENTAYSKKK